ncbi:MAG: hypothetical protein LBM97_00085 [Candidatus Nomurabacteria bacterium]|nr:hypothetical protein [Candidatus Nomurabacteria bacterium]
MSENEQKPVVPVPPVAPVLKGSAGRKEVSQTTIAIRQVCAWVTIISAAVFAFIAILAVWQVFGDITGDVVGRALGSLFIIGFASGVIAVVSSLLNDNRN